MGSASGQIMMQIVDGHRECSVTDEVVIADIAWEFAICIDKCVSS